MADYRTFGSDLAKHIERTTPKTWTWDAGEHLDSAWSEAEAALPEGYSIEMLERIPGGWQVIAEPEDITGTVFAEGASPAAALRSLAEKLRG